MFIQGSSVSWSLAGMNQVEVLCVCVYVGWGCEGGGNKIALTSVIYRFICVLV